MAKGLADYGLIAAQIEALAEEDAHWVPLLANASALVMDGVEDLNWAGFYLMRPAETSAAAGADAADGGRELVLGPFQGKVACVRIAVGRGVCGTRVCRAHCVRQRFELRGGGADSRWRARRGRAGRGLPAGGKVWRGGRARDGGRGRRHRALLQLWGAGVADAAGGADGPRRHRPRSAYTSSVSGCSLVTKSLFVTVAPRSCSHFSASSSMAA